MYNREILEAVMKLDMKRPIKLTFLAFARFARADGREIWPGYEAIAAELRCSERQIKRDMAHLIADGWLIPDGKLGYTNRYRVDRAKLGLPEVPLEKAKIRGKVVLEPTPPAPPMPGLTGGEASPEEKMYRNMQRIKQRLGSYWRLRTAKSKDAWLQQPSRDELSVFVREYRAMVNRLDGQAREFEVESFYAETILREEGAMV